MDIRDIAQTIKAGRHQAEIIGYADSVCYHAALVRKEDRYSEVIQDETGRAVRFKSMAQAKDWLRALGFDRVTFRMESPYDECFGDQSKAAAISIPMPH